MIYYTIYKVTNKVNGKIYIGSHKTKNLDDNYMGSGKYLIHAQKKYGLENFTREILYIFDNPDLMYAKEAEIVNEDFLSENNTYNLKIGGFGGFDYINNTGKNLYGMNGKTPNVTADLARGRATQKTLKDEDTGYATRIYKKISNSLKGRPGRFAGKCHTEETKRIIGEKSSIHQKGIKNSQFGTCWVTHNEFGNKKIHKNNLDKFLSLGYTKGRKLK